MESPQEPIMIETSPKPPRKKRLWLIGLALLVVVATIAWQFQRGSNEGQWLVGHWTSVHMYSDEWKAEREWTFEPNGRVIGTNMYVIAGKTPSTSTQKVVGQWAVRDGSLHIKFDRSSLQDLALVRAQAYAAVRNTLTGQSLKVVDDESANGEIVQDAADRFTVKWLDPSSTPVNSMAPQIWTRVQ